MSKALLITNWKNQLIDHPLWIRILQPLTWSSFLGWCVTNIETPLSERRGDSMWCVVRHFPLKISLCWRNQSNATKCGHFRLFDVSHRFFIILSPRRSLFFSLSFSLQLIRSCYHFSLQWFHTQCCLEDLHIAIFQKPTFSLSLGLPKTDDCF